MKPATTQTMVGDCRKILPTLADESVQCVVTSPPYFGLRSYLLKDHPDKGLEIGSEKAPEDWLATMVQVFREVRRVLRADGTCWVNLGDTMNFGKSRPTESMGNGFCNADGQSRIVNKKLGPKQILGMPWRFAFALQADGWLLRQDIIWAKPNPMPESVTDRCTKAHEYIFLLTKSPRYYYDATAIRNPPSEAMLKQVAEGYNGHATKLFDDAKAQDASATKTRIIEGARNRILKVRGHDRDQKGMHRWDNLTKAEQIAAGSNKHSVWTIPSEPFKGKHFATFPRDLVRPCILAGSKPGDTILDPFGGSGTVGNVATEYGRNAILIELNPEYIPLIDSRTSQGGLVL